MPDHSRFVNMDYVTFGNLTIDANPQLPPTLARGGINEIVEELNFSAVSELVEIIMQMHPNVSVIAAMDEATYIGIEKIGNNYQLLASPYLDDNFDDYNNGDIDGQKGWTGGWHHPTVEDTEVVTGKAVYFSASTTHPCGSTGTKTLNMGSITKAIFYIYGVDATTGYCSIRVWLKEDATHKLCVRMCSSYIDYYDADGNWQHICAATSGTWYKIEILYDNENKLYTSIKVDDVEKITNGTGQVSNNLTEIFLESGADYGSDATTAYIDEIYIEGTRGCVTTNPLVANAAVLSFFSHLKGKFSNGDSTHVLPVGVEIFGNALIVEDCEDAWNELVDGDVTSEIDSGDFKTGSASIKLIVADAVAANDILATEAITSLNISQAENVVMWIKSSVATSSGDLQLLLDDTAQCASPLKSLDIPALTAGVWTKVELSLGNASGLTAIISVGLKYVTDFGACIIWVDDIEAPYSHPLNGTTKFKIDPTDPRIELYRVDDTVVAKSDAQTNWVLDDNATNGAFPAKTTATYETILAEEIGCASVVMIEKSVNGAFTDTELLVEDDDYTVDYSTRTATKITLTTSAASDIVISQSKLRITWIVDVENIDGTANTALKMKIHLNRTVTSEASPEIQEIDLGTDKYAEMKYICG